ncbi:hypothetical protein [Flavobacterium urumqiense]|uniref:Uncharacterized protein n=1 Tax=Flavobacterium urumqiense TaxID=935224 RepID=A0A1H5YK13_9FLAO|nr:hypothetical protein [Flavobacterium urumqiense]SEG23877.1 hypothetical protein SAMN04488130_10822 [Flavobacterium urumqiense]
MSDIHETCQTNRKIKSWFLDKIWTSNASCTIGQKSNMIGFMSRNLHDDFLILYSCKNNTTF